MSSKYFRRKKKNKNKNKGNKNKIAQCSVTSFRIDLNVAPSQRWRHIILCYQKPIKKLIDSILSMDQYQLSDDDNDDVANNNDNDNKSNNQSDFFTNLTNGIFNRLRNLGGNEYIEEMKGIASLYKNNIVKIEHVLLTHLLYESFCGCTSIVSKSINNSNSASSLVLGRTLDWLDFDDQLLRNLTIDIDVYKGNQYLYKFTTFAGYIGVLTGLKFNTFGFAINFREFSTNELTDDQHQLDSWPIGLFGRYVCDKSNNYTNCVKLWNETSLMAPVYVIIVGMNDSILITRDENQSIKPLNMSLNNNNINDNDNNDINVNDNDNVNVNMNMKYILQTNIDHWIYDYNSVIRNKNKNKNKRKNKKKNKNKNQIQLDTNTMDSIGRLNIGYKYLNDCQGILNENGMWKLLYEYPIHDKHWTLYTTVMNVQTGYYKTIRHIYK